MPLVTNIIQAEEQFRKTFLTDQVQTIAMANKQQHTANLHCYLVTASDFCDTDPFRNDYLLLSSEPSLTTIDKQFSLISLSKAMFKNAKPLEGTDLALLNQTYSKYFSKTPTRL